MSIRKRLNSLIMIIINKKYDSKNNKKSIVIADKRGI